MRTKLQQAWIDALRSGKYKQGKFALQDEYNSFCCLGVACKVVNKMRKKRIFKMDCGHEYSDEDAYITLNKLFGVELVRGMHSNPRDFTLVYKNDALNWTFSRIADFLEKQWPLEGELK